ncbi:acetylornithine deacetylase [Rhizobium rhizogenes]|uniref:acetylornithine deacetylase n=1 Tax=Rhizobium rhizogenes TaxID=359 RepID=UPI0015748A10|nr:acetylornithine deacetylase [Rhizobium rhizogenes]NTH22901.1 acetylornithine deacetylase [Rhizobium rhizogenes]NTH35930.1 acetylornithine deacetylase [Rhizobium rhizogenes]
MSAEHIPSSISLLDKLVSFASVAGTSNLAIAAWIENALAPYGISFSRFANRDGDRTNLWATIGPKDVPGVILSGHLDVVPATSTDPSYDPFSMTVTDGSAHGRGTTDMKGFVACAMRAAMLASRGVLKRPLHLAFSYDEELGCVGVRDMLDGLHDLAVKPLFCLVGEPTEMQVVVAHKGKVMGRIRCHGTPGHSSDPLSGVNAIQLAANVVVMVGLMQESMTQAQAAPGFTVPFSTIHVGIISGGSALNVIPAQCEISFEIRNAPVDDIDAILRDLRDRAAAVASDFGNGASVTIEIDNQYPPLDTNPNSPEALFLLALTDSKETLKVSYGTEAGLFAQYLGVPALVCGPGSVKQAHRADEFISVQQLDAYDALLARLTALLETDFSMRTRP